MQAPQEFRTAHVQFSRILDPRDISYSFWNALNLNFLDDCMNVATHYMT